MAGGLARTQATLALVSFSFERGTEVKNKNTDTRYSAVVQLDTVEACLHRVNYFVNWCLLPGTAWENISL